MRIKYYNDEDFKKKLKREAAFSGVASEIIGILIVAAFAFIAFDTHSLGLLVFGLILGGVFIAAGIYFFRRQGIIEKRDRDLDDPESSIYRKNQIKLEAKRNKILKKCENHKSLRYILCFRATVLRGMLTALLILQTFLFLGTGTLAIGMMIADFWGIVSVIRAFTGKHYRQILKGYAEHGMDRREAESDFAATKAYISDFEVMSVSQKIFLSTATADVLSVSSIVWVYSAYAKFDEFKRKGVHSYSKRTHHLILGLENGSVVQIGCPEELCSVIINDLVHYGNCITTGYSEEMKDLYVASPENFRYAVKPLTDVKYEPVNMILVPAQR